MENVLNLRIRRLLGAHLVEMKVDAFVLPVKKIKI
jgi:hypothetical protein